MPRRYKLTRPELKRQRDLLRRFERYLPMLKLKQQQLQLKLFEVRGELERAAAHLARARARVDPYRPLLGEPAGVDLAALGRPERVEARALNVAGVTIRALHEVVFGAGRYSLFGTPAWVDRTVQDLREISRRECETAMLEEQTRVLACEITRIVQRVNLFEKVKIPQSRAAIRVIRIQLGDEMTAAVGRAKMAKTKVVALERDDAPLASNGAEAGAP
jgi:V/A-type H+-transporting ATPase subunit D